MIPVTQHKDHGGVARIRNLPQPVASDEPARLADLNAAIEGLAWKDSARVATQANVNLASPGATIDGVTMVAGDRVLVMSQSTAAQNGIYVWNGASTAMTRAFDAQVANDYEEATLTVEEGTSAGATYRQTAVNFTIGTDAINWTAFGASVGNATTSTAGKVRLATQAEVNTGTDAGTAVSPATLAGSAFAKLKYATTIGDGSATSYTVTHNLGTTDVQVEVYETSGSYRRTETEVQHSTANSLTILFAAPPASGAYKVVVTG